MDSRPDRRNKAAFSNFSGVDGASGFTPKITLSYPVFLQSAGKFGFFFLRRLGNVQNSVTHVQSHCTAH